MVNALVRLFVRKEIILFAPHRNSNALKNEANRKRYIFINPLLLWKLTAIAGRSSKRRYRLMAFFLHLIRPKYIIDINWITRLHTLYFVWCRNNGKKFIVVQHGAYVAGNITDIPHRLVKCQVMFCWSEYFQKLLQQYNPGKKVIFPVFGNPPFNQYKRDQFSYRDVSTKKKILFVIAPFKEQRLKILLRFMQTLANNGCDIYLKEHPYQATRSKPIEGFKKVSGLLYDVLQNEKYDIVVTDVSSSMADIIFFKNRAIYFSPDGDDVIYNEPNLYGRYLKNAANHTSSLTTFESLVSFSDVDAQEQLLKKLVKEGDNLIGDY